MSEKNSQLSKDDENTRYCPIMTAGNVSSKDGFMGIPNQYKVKCMEKKCAMWNGDRHRCGLVSLR
jgi:hypothetical protein